MSELSFDVTPEDDKKVWEILARCERLGVTEKFNRATHAMDLMACIANGCPLRLDDMLEADEFNLSHDIHGLNKHIDKLTGKLTDHFLPRFARNEENN